MRKVAPTCSGDSVIFVARTGAPARPRTTLMPSVRSIVDLPDMFEPDTT
jgi:hypothetical protein